jgi:hypothetical protein
MDPSRLRFRLIAGYEVPEGSPSSAADRNPVTWVPTLVAAFNSGYKLRDRVGGYFVGGTTVSPLRPGMASLVLLADGSLRIGAWGDGLSMTPDTVAVRQNLPPLVQDGISRATAADTPRTWGIANGNRARVNRSALGELADGSFVFEFGHDVTALDMASGLVAIGARFEIDLDMNTSWPTGFVYRRAAGKVVGTAINPSVVRPPSIYLQQFKKDFLAVSSR